MAGHQFAGVQSPLSIAETIYWETAKIDNIEAIRATERRMAFWLEFLEAANQRSGRAMDALGAMSEARDKLFGAEKALSVDVKECAGLRE